MTKLTKHPTLPYRELRILFELLNGFEDEDMVTALVARRASIIRNPQCVYVALGRLRRRGLIKTTHFRARSKYGNSCLFARHALTPNGRKLIVAWVTFLGTIGAGLRHSIGW